MSWRLGNSNPDLAPFRWFLRTLRGSRGQEGSSSEQIQAGSAVHLTLEQFEAIDLPLSLPAAPWQCECRPNCSAILLQAGSKRLNCGDTAGTCFGEPSLQSGGGMVAFRGSAGRAHECREAAREAGHCLCFGILLGLGNGRSLLVVAGFGRLYQSPGQTLGRQEGWWAARSGWRLLPPTVGRRLRRDASVLLQPEITAFGRPA